MQHRITPGPMLRTASALLSASNLPTSDLTEEHCRHFFYLGSADSPTGLVGIELLGDVGLLRSLVVTPGDRRSGAGTALVEHAERHARDHGVLALYLLTTTAEAFFARRGYARAARESAPSAIRATPEFAGICPSSSAFMSKQL